MMGVNVRDGILAVGDALEEIRHVVARPFAFVERNHRLIEGDFFRIGHLFDRFAGETLAVDIDAALVADEEDAVLEFRVAILGVVEIVHRDRRAVGVIELNVKLGCRVIAVG